MERPANLLGDLPTRLDAEQIETLLSAKGVRIERIVSLGHRSPEGFWYDQPTGEWVLVVSGAARLLFEGDVEPLDLRAGDYVHIAAHRRHRVEWTDPTQPTVWLAIHY